MNDLPLRAGRAADRFGHRVRRFERRNDAFGARQRQRGRERFAIADATRIRRDC